MVKMVKFETDGSATSGTGKESLTGLEFFISPGMQIIDIYQVSCGTVANDADWDLYVDGLQTPYGWNAEELDPTKAARLTKLPTPIGIRPGARVQMKWSGQGSATSNTLTMLYE